MKEENVKSEYQRKVDKSLIPTCNIMGVNIAAINMNWLLKYIDENLSDIKGDYICVSNVHTTVTSYEDAAYCAVQNGGLMAIPDGGPLSSVGRKRGYSDMDRTTGPSLMGEIFKISAEKGYRHYFYGSTEETLKLLEEKLQENYPGIQIAGMYAYQNLTFDLMPNKDDSRFDYNIEFQPSYAWNDLNNKSAVQKSKVWNFLRNVKRRIYMLEKKKSIGYFIAVDGPNGVGKSTLIAAIKNKLEILGYDVYVTREPTDTKLGNFLREFAEQHSGVSLACMVAADRYEHIINEIMPALGEGKIVISDRYINQCLTQFIILQL